MEDLPDELLQGKTMKIYWFLLTHGESGIREIKRDLKISSPSTVSYHMNKLVDAGLASKSATDKYIVEETVKTGIIGLFIKIGTYMIPRMLFYISFLTIGCFLYLVIMFSREAFVIHTEDFLFLFFVISGTIFFCYEAYRIWIMKPL
ncbi:MAG: ArsR family transcriptional regulator [Candidatus Thorarchaeota archaeon]